MDELSAEVRRILIKNKKYRDPDYSASRLAEDLGVQACHIAGIMRTCFGDTYKNVVNSRRVTDAKKWLADEKKKVYTVDDIGVLVGFTNRSSFFTAFRKYAGCTPQEYRNSVTA